MAGLEWRILSEILRTGNMHPVSRMGLGREHFRDGEARQIFEFLRGMYQSKDTPQQLPTIGQIKQRWPGFEPTPPEGDDHGHLAVLIKGLKDNVLANDLLVLARTIEELCTSNKPEDALRELREMSLGASHRYSSTGGLDLGRMAALAKQAYGDAQKGLNQGVPWPWEPLTYDTLGKRAQDFILIYGRPKSLKTWVSLVSAVEDVTVHRKRVLYLSREMTPSEMPVRVASIIAHVDYTLLEHGNLPSPLEHRYFAALEALHDMYAFPDMELHRKKAVGEPQLIMFTGSDCPLTIEEVSGLIRYYEPDVVYLDAAYKFDCVRAQKYRSDQEKQRVLMEDMRDLALQNNIPVVATAQANRSGEKTYGDTTADLGRTDAGAAEVTHMIRVIKKKQRDIYDPDYEGYWDEIEKQKGTPPPRRFKLSPSARAHIAREYGISEPRRPRQPRTGAEVALMLAAGRRGTMDGLLISMVPGYKYDMLRADVSPDEVRRWVEEQQQGEEEVRQTQRKQPEVRYERDPRAMKTLKKKHLRNGAIV